MANASERQLSNPSLNILPAPRHGLAPEDAGTRARPALPADEHEVDDDYLEQAVRLVTASAEAAAKAHQSAQQFAHPQSDAGSPTQDHPAPGSASLSRPAYGLSLFHSSPFPPTQSQAQKQPQDQSSSSRSPSSHTPDPRPHPLASHPNRVLSATPRNPIPESKSYHSLGPQAGTRSWYSQTSITGTSLPPTPGLEGKRPRSPQADSARSKRRNNSRRRAKDGDPTPWQCTDCGRRYSRAEYMRRHRRTHEQVRPWSCVCGKTFGRSDVFTRHRRQCRMIQSAAMEAALARPAPGLLVPMGGVVPSPPPTVAGQSTGAPTPQTGSPAPMGCNGTVQYAGQMDLSPGRAVPSCFSSREAGRDGSPANSKGGASPSPSLSAPCHNRSHSPAHPTPGDENFSPGYDTSRAGSTTPAGPSTQATTAATDDTRELTCFSHSPAATQPGDECALAPASGEVEEQGEMRFLNAPVFADTMSEEHDVLESLRRLLEGHGSETDAETRCTAPVQSPDASDADNLDVSVFPAQSIGGGEEDAHLSDLAHLPSSLGEGEAAGPPVDDPDFSNLPLVFEFPGASDATSKGEPTSTRTDAPEAMPDVPCPSSPGLKAQSRPSSSANAFSSWNRQARPFDPHSVLRGMAAATPGLHFRLPLSPDGPAASSHGDQDLGSEAGSLDPGIVPEEQAGPCLLSDERHEVQTC